MGSVSIDTEKKGRNLSEKYTLNTPEGVIMILEDVSILKERRYMEGDYDACIILLDLEEAIKKAKLTKRQAEAIYLYYIEGHGAKEASRLMGIKNTKAADYAKVAVERIAGVFSKWQYNEI